MEKELNGDEVIVEISGAEEKSNSSYLKREDEDTEKLDPEGFRSRENVPSFNGSLNEEISTTSQQADEARSQYSKAESRFGEVAAAGGDDDHHHEEDGDVNFETRNKSSSFKNPEEVEAIEKQDPEKSRSVEKESSIFTDDDDDDDVIFKARKKRSRKMKVCFIEFSLFVCITLVIILSKTIDKLKNREIWSLELWKWCVLVLPVFCGRLFSEWLTNVLLFLIEKEYVLEKNYLYYFYRRQKSVHVFIWLGLILPTWCVLINRGDHRSKDTKKILNYITRGIASSLVVAGAWVVEVLFVSMLYSSFYVKRHFRRTREDIFNGYIVETLSRAPVMKTKTKTKTIDVTNLQNLKRAKVSAWRMRELIKAVRKTAFFSTDIFALNLRESTMKQNDKKGISITSEMEVRATAYHIFRNVAQPGITYIEDSDLRRFLKKEDVDIIFPKMDKGKRGKVNVYDNHKSLVNSLNDTKDAIEKLNKFLTGCTVAVLIILWLILTGIATTEVLLFISSQVLLAVFSFGATAKSTVEEIIFVFVKYPFDVGDRCVVDGVQVVVEKISIMTTVFLRYDNEKIYYPNSLLSTKSISNFNRSPDMSDSVDFDLDVSTSVEKILALKEEIKRYIEGNNQLWNPRHKIVVREIEGVNKIKMSLYVTHTINFQNYLKKISRRSKLMFKLKNIFEKLGINYHILPPRSSDSATTATFLP